MNKIQSIENARSFGVHVGPMHTPEENVSQPCCCVRMTRCIIFQRLCNIYCSDYESMFKFEMQRREKQHLLPMVEAHSNLFEAFYNPSIANDEVLKFRRLVDEATAQVQSHTQ